MDINNLYDLYLSASGVSTDTRSLKEGNLFFALMGENFNGNLYAEKALEDGAIAAVIDDPKFEGANTVLVPNVLETLQELARFHRRQFDFPVIGLTGSNGKTTSKELLAAALSKHFKVGYTQGNFNNHIGVPLTLLGLPEDTEVAVIEMGANAQKEIAFLSSISQPDIGFITNYGKAHLEGFGGVEGIIKGKSELYDYLRESEGICFVNALDQKQLEKSAGIKRFTLGNSPEADYPVFPVEEAHPQNWVAARYEGVLIQSCLSGAYNFNNMALAIAIARYLGVPVPQIKEGIEAYQPNNNRSQYDQGLHNELIRDYYNANPSSMEAALLNLSGLKREGRPNWAILGDMFEMGEYESEEHQKIVDIAAQQELEELILVGEAFAKTTGVGRRFKTTPEAIAWIEKHLPKEKLILVKGSRGMTLEKVAELL